MFFRIKSLFYVLFMLISHLGFLFLKWIWTVSGMDDVWNFSTASDLMLIRIELNCVNIDYELGEIGLLCVAVVVIVEVFVRMARVILM